MSHLSVVQRIVTGETTDGRAVFTLRDEVQPIVGRSNLFPVWGWDEAPVLPCCPTDAYQAARAFPDTGGVRVNVVEFAPAEEVRANSGTRESMTSGERVVLREPDGMHQTNTIDIVFALSGEVDVEQDDGAIVTLRPGTVLIQNGAKHAWRRRPGASAVVGIVVLPAERLS